MRKASEVGWKERRALGERHRRLQRKANESVLLAVLVLLATVSSISLSARLWTRFSAGGYETTVNR